VFRDLQRQLGDLLGRTPDPLGVITPEQLKVVLKNIETRYHDLREENGRLRRQSEESRAVAERLEAERDVALREAERGPEAMLSRMAEMQRELVAARDGQEQLAHEVARMREAVGEAEGLRDQALADARGMQIRVLVLEAERDRLLVAEDRAEEARADAEEARGLMVQDLDAAREENVRLGLRVEALAADLAAREEALSTEREGRDAALRLLAADPEKEALKEQIRELEARVSELEAQLVSRQEELAAEVGSVVDEALLAEQQAESRLLEERLAQAEGQRDELGRIVEALRGEQDRLTAEMRRLGEGQGDIQARMSDLSLRTRREPASPPDPGDMGELRQQMVDLGHKLDRMVQQRGPERGRQRAARPEAGADPARKLDWLMGR
jgi:chromosome segregation ATPase